MIPSFQAPFRTVEQYLENLAALDILAHFGRQWRVSDTVRQRSNEQRRQAQVRREQRQRVEATVNRLLKNIPEAERRSFNLATWFNRAQPGFQCSFSTGLEAGGSISFRLVEALDEIQRMVFHKGPAVRDLLGLPLEAERARQNMARLKEAELFEERESQRRETSLTNTAIEYLGESASDWLEQAHPALDNQTPRQSARANQAGLYRAEHMAWKESRRRSRVAHREHLAARFQEHLIDYAERKIGRERAQVFLRSAHPRLGRQRPVDYCIDEVTLKICMQLLEPDRKTRRSRR